MTTVPQPPSDRTRCQKVIEQARDRLLDILYPFADGLTPKQVAEQLIISIKTVDGYKTELLKLCRTVWNIPADVYLDYHFLREKFAWLGETADNTTIKRERMYCQWVISQIQGVKLEILRLLAAGLHPKEVAWQCEISQKMVDYYKTDLLMLSRTAWNMPYDEYLDYHFLYEKFSKYPDLFPG